MWVATLMMTGRVTAINTDTKTMTIIPTGMTHARPRAPYTEGANVGDIVTVHYPLADWNVYEDGEPCPIPNVYWHWRDVSVEDVEREIAAKYEILKSKASASR